MSFGEATFIFITGDIIVVSVDFFATDDGEQINDNGGLHGKDSDDHDSSKFFENRNKFLFHYQREKHHEKNYQEKNEPWQNAT